MPAIHRPNRRPLTIVTLLLALSLITGCGGSTPAPTPTQPPSPTPKPSPDVTVDVSPGLKVPVGESVAIVINVKPYEQLDWNWNVSGTSGGQLNTRTGENVVYTAGKEGMDNVVAEAKTADGATVKKTVSLTVVAAPATAIPTEPPAPTKVPPTATLATSGVTLVEPQNGQTVKCQIIAEGAYPLDLREQIWPIVYINGVYHPQDEGGKAAQKNSGKWLQTVRFGNCDELERDRGKPFTLIIVTADDSANGEFGQYLRTAKANLDWRGMPALPPGTTEYARIIVTRE